VLNNNKVLEEIKYEKLVNGTVADKLNIVYKFHENFSKSDGLCGRSGCILSFILSDFYYKVLFMLKAIC
jgi:hypothetical protein